MNTSEPRRRCALWLRISGALAISLMSACKPDTGVEAVPVSPELEVLVRHCNSEMMANTCKVMKDSPRSSVPEGSAVIVAGVGRVDAVTYSALRDAGEAMCGEVRKKCLAEWNGKACQTARQIWGGPSSQ